MGLVRSSQSGSALLQFGQRTSTSELDFANHPSTADVIVKRAFLHVESRDQIADKKGQAAENGREVARHRAADAQAGARCCYYLHSHYHLAGRGAFLA